jgi:hypothetical protein
MHAARGFRCGCTLGPPSPRDAAGGRRAGVRCPVEWIVGGRQAGSFAARRAGRGAGQRQQQLQPAAGGGGAQPPSAPQHHQVSACPAGQQPRPLNRAARGLQLFTGGPAALQVHRRLPGASPHLPGGGAGGGRLPAPAHPRHQPRAAQGRGLWQHERGRRAAAAGGDAAGGRALPGEGAAAALDSAVQALDQHPRALRPRRWRPTWRRPWPICTPPSCTATSSPPTCCWTRRGAPWCAAGMRPSLPLPASVNLAGPCWSAGGRVSERGCVVTDGAGCTRCWRHAGVRLRAGQAAARHAGDGHRHGQHGRPGGHARLHGYEDEPLAICPDIAS